jgi:hypothetical protein
VRSPIILNDIKRTSSQQDADLVVKRSIESLSAEIDLEEDQTENALQNLLFDFQHTKRTFGTLDCTPSLPAA